MESKRRGRPPKVQPLENDQPSEPRFDGAFFMKEEEPMASKVSPPVTGCDSVVVYCKVPSGLQLRAGEFYERVEGSIDGRPRTVREWRQTREPFTVAGPATPFGAQPKAIVVGGYALTMGVPRDLWEAWLSENERTTLVTSGMIFARDAVDYAGKAKEQEAIKTGFEPLNQGSDSRVPGSERLEKMNQAAA